MENVSKSSSLLKIVLVVGVVAAAAVMLGYFNKKPAPAPVSDKKSDDNTNKSLGVNDVPPASIVPLQVNIDKIGSEDAKAITNYDASPRTTFPTPPRLLVGSDWPMQSNQDLQVIAKQ